jgi:2-methylcitrate dehydratase PrpD
MTKPLHAGLANRSGIEAALLAQSGFTASAEILEQRFGWHDVICRGEGDLAVVLDGLGDSYAIEEGLVFKAYPCCGANHYAIDAVVNLLRENSIGEPDVATLDVWLEQRNLNDVLVYPWARTPLEGKFSLPYNMAAALADGEVTVRTFTDESVARLAPFRAKVRVHPTTDLPANGARIRVLTTDGRTIDREQLVNRGSLADPMTWDELERKFRANTRGRIEPAAADEAVTAIASLEKQETVTGLGQALLGRR